MGDYQLVSDEKPNPEDRAGVLSKIIFSYMNPLLRVGHKRPIVHEDLWDVSKQDKAEHVSQHFEEIWDQEIRKKPPSLWKAFVRAFGRRFFMAGLIKILYDSLIFFGPIFLEAMVNFVSSEQPLHNGFLYALGLLIPPLIQSVLLQQYFHSLYRLSVHTRISISATVYRKSLRLSSGARQTSTAGEIVNLMSVDAQRISDQIPYLHQVWSAPLQIIVALLLLYRLLGWAAAAGLAAMLALMPFNGWLTHRMSAFQSRMMTVKDERVKIMNEILQGIRAVKFFAWESSFVDRVSEIRNREVRALRWVQYINGIMGFFWTSTPILVSIATFTVYSALGHRLSPSIAFTALALFNILRFPLIVLPDVISGIVAARVSLGRLRKFLLLEELEVGLTGDSSPVKSPLGSTIDSGGDKDNVVLSIRDASFRWDSDEGDGPLTLSSINLKVKRGQLVMVMGTVGGGKSSLLAALLGEIRRVAGTVQVRGSISYVAQTAWILNSTLKENVIYGQTLDERRYADAIRVSALTRDLQVLPAGDNTEIGEKGINLSGGQKQRVSLARAVYRDADIFLLDDPLAALDTHVSSFIMDNCILDKLSNKTRILVTHKLDYLTKADLIVVMKDGRISEQGSYSELVASGLNFASLVQTHGMSHDSSEATSPNAEDDSPTPTGPRSPSIAASTPKEPPEEGEQPKKKAKEEEGGQLMSTEERNTGSVSWKIYVAYLAGMGVCTATFILSLYIFTQVARILSDWWLSYWSSQAQQTGGVYSGTRTLYWYMGIYMGFAIGTSLLFLVQSLMFAQGALNSARRMHEDMLKNVIRAPMSFFETTPVGRVLNRFSKDVDSIDNVLPESMSSYMACLTSVFGSIAVICVVLPLFILAVIPLGAIYFFIQEYYRRTSRELKRLDSVSRSPIFAHFGETLNGTVTIRAHQMQSIFVEENERRIDFNTRVYLPSIIANRWLSFRLEFVGTVIVFAAAMFAVLSHGRVDPGLIGLSLSYALQITGTLNWMVRMSTDTETQMNAVERVRTYSEIPTEPPLSIPSANLPKTWPAHGAINMNNLYVLYREGLPFVLKGITLAVRPSEKIGVVGRTGAGKSSLVLAIYRMLNIVSGSVSLDGVDICSIGIHDLRSKLSIIPQDPVLFSGTIRSNLDPFGTYNDADLWHVLEHAHLKSAVQQMPDKLDSTVAEGGENLSVGQRQLLCLARALLRQSKVLVLDEATASVDVETDALVQTTLRTECKTSTLLIIAHRLNTIIDADRVLVLSDGQVAEFDRPSILLETPSSIFSSLVDGLGPQQARHLRRLAKAAAFDGTPPSPSPPLSSPKTPKSPSTPASIKDLMSFSPSGAQRSSDGELRISGTSGGGVVEPMTPERDSSKPYTPRGNVRRDK